MNHLPSVEQLYSDLVSLSPDFVHDEKKIKELLQAMITSKPQAQQDSHFKENLLQRLQQHIARHKNPSQISELTQSRISWLARLVAYGLPSLAICFVIWFTWPMHEYGQKMEKTAEMEHVGTIGQTSLNDESVSNGVEEKISNISLDTKYAITAKKGKSQEIISKADSSSMTALVTTESSLDITSLQDAVVDESAQSKSLFISKTASPSVGASDGPQAMGTTNFALPVVTDETLSGWQMLGEKMSLRLGISLQFRSGSLLDCHREDSTLFCDVLANRAISSEHKMLLREEIIKNLSADTVSDEQKERMKKDLGL